LLASSLLELRPHYVVALSLGNRASIVAGSASLFRFPYAMALVPFRYKYNENLPNDFRQMSFSRMRRSSQQASHECMPSILPYSTTTKYQARAQPFIRLITTDNMRSPDDPHCVYKNKYALTK
jgi:hypothetical protein